MVHVSFLFLDSEMISECMLAHAQRKNSGRRLTGLYDIDTLKNN